MKIRIGERLIKAGVVDESQIEKALARQRVQGGRLGDNLIELGFIDEQTLRAFVHRVPHAPGELKDTGLPEGFIAELVLKTAFYQAAFTAKEISSVIRLAPSLLIGILEQLKTDKYIQIKGADSYFVGSVHYSLTELGRKRAHELLALNSYVGPAPVPLEAYVEMVWHQTIQSTVADEPVVRSGFKDLVLKEEVFDQLGPAINSGRSLFLYGPPGTGKTSVAKDIAELFQEDVFIPYAVYAHGQMIQLYDPISHEPSARPPEAYDARWSCCKRPVVVVGGEMTMNMLDLNLDPVSHCYDAPLQLKANNGVLIIDDFGRQRISIRDLLNRWIIPLETGQEHLGLQTGQKFTVPFDVLVIFCTNIAPKELVDEAFLRRIRHKIKLDYVSPAEFLEILRINCDRNEIPYDERAAAYLLEKYYAKPQRPIVAAHARDIVDHIVDYARYRRTAPVLSTENIDIACSTYFVEGY